MPSVQYLLLLLFLAKTVSGLKMVLDLEPRDNKCFFQMLMAQQKYSVHVNPLQVGKYQLNIKHQINGIWQHSVHRTAFEPMENISLFKLAKHEALYSYCVINSDTFNIKLRFEISWGLELLDLKVVAQQDDSKKIEREAKWIDKQVDKIQESIQSAFAKRKDRDEYANLMRKKMIGYALLGLIGLFGIGIFFYISIRKAFHQRKLI